MSIKLMAQVWEADLPSSEKFVLLALADHARDDGSRVYPSIKSLALKTGFSERAVQYKIRALLERGILIIVKKSVRYGTTEYFIRGDKLTPLRGADFAPLRGANDDTQGCTTCTPGVQNTTSRGAPRSFRGAPRAPESSLTISKPLDEPSKPSSSEHSFRLAELLLSLILSRKPDFKKPNLQSWAQDIDRMLRLDKRNPSRVEAVIRWTQQDPFWQANILSVRKLREKFDHLELKMNRPGTKSSDHAQRPGDRCEDLSKYDAVPVEELS